MYTLISPRTSALVVDVLNHESSPYLPGLYLEVGKSLGKPHTTDTKCGRCFEALLTFAVELLAVSSNVENPLRNAREITRVVQLNECITNSRFLLFAESKRNELARVHQLNFLIDVFQSNFFFDFIWVLRIMCRLN